MRLNIRKSFLSLSLPHPLFLSLLLSPFQNCLIEKEVRGLYYKRASRDTIVKTYVTETFKVHVGHQTRRHNLCYINLAVCVVINVVCENMPV